MPPPEDQRFASMDTFLLNLKIPCFVNESFALAGPRRAATRQTVHRGRICTYITNTLVKEAFGLARMEDISGGRRRTLA